MLARLEVGQRRAQVVDGRWNERRRVGSVVGGADPVLATSQMTRVTLLPPHSREQYLVHPEQEARRDREFRDELAAELERLDVVGHLGELVVVVSGVRFDVEHIGPRCLRSFDAVAGERFTREVRANEQMWVRQDPSPAVPMRKRSNPLVKSRDRSTVD